MKAARRTTIWVGTYAEKGGRGLYPVKQSALGEWLVGEPFEAASNASFGARSARHGLCYLVDEQGGKLRTCRHDGGWSELTAMPTGGPQPCYVALDAEEARLAVANYGDGSIALVSLDAGTGLPDGKPNVRNNSGKGPNSERQDGPHAHCVRFSPGRRWLYQVDLGTDEVMASPLDRATGDRRCAYRAPPGSGPRHLLFHPGGSTAFLVCELDSSVHVLEMGDPDLSPRQSLSTLPEAWSGESLGGHIGLNWAGDRLYVTNRGHDSIATYAFDGERLNLLQHVRSGGSSPRFFLLLEEERLMFVANEEGGNVTQFHILDDGTLEATGVEINIPGPAYLLSFDAAGE